MTKSDEKEISKFLSYVLRHKPEAIGLKLDDQGWADLDELIAHADRPLDRAVIDQVVQSSDKQRFAISEDGQRIRANQGHSVKVDLGLQPRRPPDLLYHGTAERNLTSILNSGLSAQARHHVHLSSDTETARKVAMRHGKPVVLTVDARRMQAAGHLFYLSENGVWLTRSVPVEFLAR